jgi:uracil-DNA glycosylase
MHGANRTGRPFTGDYAGVLLYRPCIAIRLSLRPSVNPSRRDDGLLLIGCRITNAVKCVPPANKPETAEIRTCNRHLPRNWRRAGGARHPRPRPGGAQRRAAWR